MNPILKPIEALTFTLTLASWLTQTGFCFFGHRLIASPRFPSFFRPLVFMKIVSPSCAQQIWSHFLLYVDFPHNENILWTFFITFRGVGCFSIDLLRMEINFSKKTSMESFSCFKFVAFVLWPMIWSLFFATAKKGFNSLPHIRGHRTDSQSLNLCSRLSKRWPCNHVRPILGNQDRFGKEGWRWCNWASSFH